MRNFTYVAASMLGAFLMAGAPAAAQTASSELLGNFQSWSAYTSGSGAQKTCYAMAEPSSSLPRKAKRDSIRFLISDWPGRRAKNEAEILPGYKFQEGSDVTAQVGGQKFAFFTKNDSDDGTAWVQDINDEAKLVDAMTRGGEIIVTGTSMRGTATKDTYALDGLEQALDRIHSTCGM